MIRRPPRYTRTDTLFPYTTLFRSILLRPSATRTTAAPFYPAAAERRLVPRLRRRAIAATFAGASGRHSRRLRGRRCRLALLLHQADLRQVAGHGRKAFAQQALVFLRRHVDRLHADLLQIGTASCRENGGQYGES